MEAIWKRSHNVTTRIHLLHHAIRFTQQQYGYNACNSAWLCSKREFVTVQKVIVKKIFTKVSRVAKNVSLRRFASFAQIFGGMGNLWFSMVS